MRRNSCEPPDAVETASDTVAVVTFPEAEGEADLLEVVDAVDALRLALGGGERREQHGREDGDDGDHDEQLDERERRFLFESCFHTLTVVQLLLFSSGDSRRTLPESHCCQPDF